MTRQEPPENVRELPVTSDERLSAQEKETNLNFPNDLECGTITSEVPSVMKWVLSVSESRIKWVRLTESDEIIALQAEIPKGIVKLQQSARKSNQHSQMVSYGEEYNHDAN